MREWRGLKVPCEPKKEWIQRLKARRTCTATGGIYCTGINCPDCIYSFLNITTAEQFYNECFPEKPKKLPRRDSNGRFCKKTATLPKLTVEVFNRPDCPDWARWAAVDKCGEACWYKDKPICGGARKWYPIEADGLNKMVSRTLYNSFDWRHSLIERPANELPKLTVEVFNEPDCPDWVQYAAVDVDGTGCLYEELPIRREKDWRVKTFRIRLGEGPFDASDWQHSLIQRPVKELPKLTQTAFHSPDCPKEATTLKVFPANHVVALDKNNKVLRVMELQCKEGEVKKPVSDWYYSPAADDLYRADESDRRIPEDAYPVEVYHHSPGYLVGLAVTHRLTERIYLISDVRGNLVTLKGIDREDVLSMVSLILNYRFTGTKEFCCEFERL